MPATGKYGKTPPTCVYAPGSAVEFDVLVTAYHGKTISHFFKFQVNDSMQQQDKFLLFLHCLDIEYTHSSNLSNLTHSFKGY